jgi:adenine C2-methylase RlmN of 23S rRNA A2503 and tRNA A37
VCCRAKRGASKRMSASLRLSGNGVDMLSAIRKKEFINGTVYALKTHDGYLIECTDTFLPSYTKDAATHGNNFLNKEGIGSRKERWMIGVSVMSGCPVRCRFCATGAIKKWRNLTSSEIIEQVDFVLSRRRERFIDAFEHKINYTRMGEPFLNIEEVKSAVKSIDDYYPMTHHYISTIGIAGSDFSWIKDNITLQVSIHSLDNEKRNWLIPFKNKMSLFELGQIRTASDLKTTVNLTLVDESDFDINAINSIFDKDRFFIKLSPININSVSEANGLGAGVIQTKNIA